MDISKLCESIETVPAPTTGMVTREAPSAAYERLMYESFGDSGATVEGVRLVQKPLEESTAYLPLFDLP